MKNTLIAIVGIVIIVGLGYAVFQRPSGTDTAQANAVNETAGTYQNFSQTAYDMALADGKTVILDFHANWCPTCRANEPIITAVFKSNTNTNIVGFKIDYDNEVELKRAFNVVSQSTIIKTSANGDTQQLGPGPVTTESFTAFIQS